MTKTEAQYFKLIGVTLLMTAACVSDSGSKKSFSFYDGDVREIILEQFHMLSSSHRGQVLDWEHAVKEINELTTVYRVPTVSSVIYVVKSNQSLPDFQETVKGFPEYLSIGLPPVLLQGNYPETKSLVVSNLNKYSLAVRAGPLA